MQQRGIRRRIVSLSRLLYSDSILPQFVEELKSKEDAIHVPQLVGDLSDKEWFSIPWGHHRAIIDKCKLDREKSIFFVKKTILNNWSRAVLLNFLDTDLRSPLSR